MKQVDKSSYEFERYMSKARWISVWHQVNEVLRLKPESVLEIGPGPGLFKLIATQNGLHVETMDPDPELNPDHLGSATAIPLPDSSFDTVCAFQMLEHLPYESSLQAFGEMARISRNNIVLSLPDAEPVWRYVFHVPKLGILDWSVRRPFSRLKRHQFDGEHYWEINKKNYLLNRILSDFARIAKVKCTYRVAENPYHRFFVFEKFR